MPHPIEQPVRSPANRLPPYLRPNTMYPADIHEEAERVARIERDRQRRAAPAMGITRIDIPFWDVFCFALKFFIAHALISVPFAVLLWLAFIA